MSTGARKILFLYSFFIIAIVNRSLCSNHQNVEQLKIGNFALPSSQQPGPLIGFGQNMLDQQDLQFFNYVDILKGCNKQFTGIVPSILYGFTSDCSLFIQLPIAAKFKENGSVYQGIQEVVIQLEYSFYNTVTPTSTNQVSIVSNIGLTPYEPRKGIGRASAITNLFLGFTASHMGDSWYPFTSVGMIFALKDDDTTKYGNQVLYQCGLSRNISYKEDTYILNWMFELDGYYKQQDKVCCKIDPNSGSNMILFGPSLWFSTQKISIQAGISGVIYEKLTGVQNKNKYYVTIDCGWKF